MNHAAYIASLNIGEFRSFRRALQILYRSGMNTDMAIELLVKASMERNRLRHEHLERSR